MYCITAHLVKSISDFKQILFIEFEREEYSMKRIFAIVQSQGNFLDIIITRIYVCVHFSNFIRVCIFDISSNVSYNLVTYVYILYRLYLYFTQKFSFIGSHLGYSCLKIHECILHERCNKYYNQKYWWHCSSLKYNYVKVYVRDWS